jgi:predicted MPP superfamily phosphohydrolase
MSKILIIPDQHSKPGVSNERFKWLGNLIVARQPDVIVNLGDMFDFPSLSSYDKGKMSSENKRYKYDLEAGIQAQEFMFTPLDDYNRGRKKKYLPAKHITLGNHEARLMRAVQENAQLEFTMSESDLQLERFGWNVTPYKQSIEIFGIYFSHYFPSGVMDRPIGGENMGRTILKKTHRSAIQGHNHQLSLGVDTNLEGKKMWGISAGCFLAENQIEDYVSITIQRTWWKGIIILNNCQNGDFDLECIRLETLKKEYS